MNESQMEKKRISDWWGHFTTLSESDVSSVYELLPEHHKNDMGRNLNSRISKIMFIWKGIPKYFEFWLT